MRSIRIAVVVSLLTVAISSCKDVYAPAIISSSNSYLVVEGVLDSGNQPTTVKITRTFGLDQYSVVQGEIGALVTVEGNDNTVQNLQMGVQGVYTGGPLALQTTNQYRLRIQTTDGKVYLSEYVTPKLTQPIDSVTWTRTPEGIDIAVNTHDQSNSSIYYRWDYTETWQLKSYYFSLYTYENSEVRERIIPEEQVYDCWRTTNSQSILLGSSAKLGQDVINQQKIATYKTGDEKFYVRYSIIVRQYALDKNAYEFYDLMKKNTESVGTIFDAQPSDIRGNISCVSDPGTPVIGFITASNVTEKRIFVNSSQVPDWASVPYCPNIVVTPDSLAYYFQGGAYIPHGANFNMMGGIDSYNASYNTCVDCRTRGGSTIQPSFW